MRAYVALGSNLGDSKQHLLDAIEALAVLPDTSLIARSRIYRTPPWGKLDQPDFLNAVVAIETSREPHDLLDALLNIERAAGRERNGERWGPRTLDLDLLYVAGKAVNSERLTLPHPHIANRAFVLLPLHDVAPELDVPGQGKVADLLRAVDTQGCTPLA
ncbi:2-amino-4-hydroxy-6-hydroxymethyldihydropteridine diphosphokinase [Dyella nitratireducens]|uniref:2-amino-4-hydroxy-6-hydroxymethyldihydropteridine pyrophosphokinase n=2 Tax=Dyella nitratireducens TaxID=1849580 RepID=A0ABQ1FL23_9GAMM|nr:2-amino-4-hydroxy-6-hydroxymethyldihydropteridine diphosphokinase [Dyella nitratireducens]GLQ44583.1 2-amino-4-hydroxy-6-hydroxymethyldihydropteridine diphosphokinase [Dyella nitratireducens]